MLARPKIALTIIFALFGIGLLLVPYAFGEESKNPIQMLWDAIYDLQNRDGNLQAQIDDLRAEKASIQQVSEPVAELSVRINVSDTLDDSESSTIKLAISNGGPDRATGVRLTLFYKMPLFKVDRIESDGCVVLERGIIECDLGTLEPDKSISVVVDVSAIENGVPTSFTVDVSSNTEDRIPNDNHIVVDYVTGANSLGKTAVETPFTDDRAAVNETSEQDNQSAEQSQTNQTSANQNETSDESSSEAGGSGEQDQQIHDQNNNQNQTSSEETSDNVSSSNSSSASESEEDASQNDESESGEASTSGYQTSSNQDDG